MEATFFESIPDRITRLPRFEGNIFIAQDWSTTSVCTLQIHSIIPDVSIVKYSYMTAPKNNTGPRA